MVLDAVVVSACDDLRDLGPLAVKFAMEQEQYPFFYFSPFTFLVDGIEMLMPSLSASFAVSVWDLFRNVGPFEADFFDQHNQSSVLI